MRTLLTRTIFCLLAPIVNAEELELFNAQTAGEEIWTWADAKIRPAGGTLVVIENNKTGSHGSVFPADRVPYSPKGEVIMDVSNVSKGTYTLQILCFAGETPIHTAEPIKDLARKGRQVIRMGDLHLPDETQSLLLKLWVANAEGASIALNNLRYVINTERSDILLEQDFKDPEEWEAADMIIERAETGLGLTLPPGQSHGNIMMNRMIERDDGALLMFHAPSVNNGTITAQIVAFDAAGNYLESPDAIKAVGSGWHGIPLKQVNWPDGAEQFKVKLWLGGSPTAEAQFDQLLLLMM